MYVVLVEDHKLITAAIPGLFAAGMSNVAGEASMTSRQQRLGWTIKTQREHRGITQEHVAENCGAKTSRTAVAHLEQGLRIPKPEVLSAICKFLEIPNAHWEPASEMPICAGVPIKDILME